MVEQISFDKFLDEKYRNGNLYLRKEYPDLVTGDRITYYDYLYQYQRRLDLHNALKKG